MIDLVHHLDNAYACYRNRDWAGAAKNCRHIVAHAPSQPEALHLLGLLAFQAEEWADAVRLIGRAVDAQPDNAIFLGNLGLAQQQAGHLDGAICAYRESLRLRADDADVRNNLGVALQEQGEFAEAASCFEHVLQLQPANVAAWNVRISLMSLPRVFGTSVNTVPADVPDWRWLLDREDSPWYPTMRLFRQRKLHDWDGVFARLAEALRRRLCKA